MKQGKNHGRNQKQRKDKRAYLLTGIAVSQKAMNELTRDVVQFCNDDSLHTFPITRRISAIAGENYLSHKVFLKIPVSSTLVAIMILQEVSALWMLSDTHSGHMSYAGFFSKATQKLYAVNQIEYLLSGSNRCLIEDPALRLACEPMPQKTMVDKLDEEITRTLLKDVVLNPVNLSDKNQLQLVSSYFFSGTMPEISVLSQDGPYGCLRTLLQSRIENDDIELYLSDEKAWLEKKSQSLLQKEKRREVWLEELTSARQKEAILEALNNAQGHIWHTIKRIMDAVRETKTVTMEIEKGGIRGEFRVSTSQFSSEMDANMTGKCSSLVILSKDRGDAQALFAGDTEKEFHFTVRNIKKIKYRNSEVYNCE